MNSLTKLIATAALLGSVSSFALAQEAATDSDAQADAPASMEEGETMSPQDVGPVTVEDIESFDEGRTLTIVTVEETQTAEGEGGLGEMVDAESEDFEAIVSAIEANPIIFDQLEAEGFTADDIVAVGMGAEGELTIHVTGAQ